jgi:MYXO-CTERM domain-containing protein
MDPIAGGRTYSGDQAVVGLMMSNGQFGGICSGSLIAPNLVLTAQHCIADLPGEGIACGQTRFGAVMPARGVFVTVRDQISNFGAGFVEVAEVHVPQERQDVCGNDIAVLILRNNIDHVQPLVPRFDPVPQRNEALSFAGYGITGENAPNSSGTRRILENQGAICAGANCRSWQVDDAEWLATDGTCQGDSGGPALDRFNQVLGALSRGGRNCSSPIYTGLWAWEDWLKGMGARAADMGRYNAPNWVDDNGPPPPDSDGDGLSDPFDNCPQDRNPNQSDADGDGIGDACDDNSNCAICNSCRDDGDCFGAEVFCAPLEDGSAICTRFCETSDDCPPSSACFDVGNGQGACLNADAAEEGLCPDDYTCGEPRQPDPVPDQSVEPDPPRDQGVPDPERDPGVEPNPERDQGVIEPNPTGDAGVSPDSGSPNPRADGGTDDPVIVLVPDDEGGGGSRPGLLGCNVDPAPQDAPGPTALLLLGAGLLLRRRRDPARRA